MNSTTLDKDISKEVDHVWAFPLTIGSVQNIKNTGVVPLGSAEQFSINKKGGCCIKRCVTRNCWFPGYLWLSVNNRVQWESLQSWFYGFLWLGIFHIVSANRNKCQIKWIIIRKTDLDASYRRIHANATTTSTCIAILHKLAFIWLHHHNVQLSAKHQYT